MTATGACRGAVRAAGPQPSSRFSSSARAFGDVVLTADRSAFGEGVLCWRAQWQVGGNPLVVREHPEVEFGVNEVAEVLEEDKPLHLPTVTAKGFRPQGARCSPAYRRRRDHLQGQMKSCHSPHGPGCGQTSFVPPCAPTVPFASQRAASGNDRSQPRLLPSEQQENAMASSSGTADVETDETGRRIASNKVEGTAVTTARASGWAACTTSWSTK